VSGRRSTDLLSRSYDPTLVQQPGIPLSFHGSCAVLIYPMPLLSLAQYATGCFNPLSNFPTGEPIYYKYLGEKKRNDKESNQARQRRGNKRLNPPLDSRSGCSTVGSVGKSPLPLPWEIVTENVSYFEAVGRPCPSLPCRR